jgi:hypothetical protein
MDAPGPDQAGGELRDSGGSGGIQAMRHARSHEDPILAPRGRAGAASQIHSAGFSAKR